MKFKVFRNWGLKLLSLVVAFVIWFLVVQINDPKDTSSFSNIKVNITNEELLEKENKVYQILDDTGKVRVTVRAPRSILQKIRSEDIFAEADMSKLTDINTIVITYDIENVDMASVEIVGNHNVVKLDVEEKKRKYIQVDYRILGELPEGYVLGSISLEQNRIEISGPQSAVDQVQNAYVEVDVNNAVGNLSADMELHLNDFEGEELRLENLNKQMNYIHVSAEILPTKTVPIRATYQGTPAQGYIVTGDVTVEPQNVLIAGNARGLANVTAIVIPPKDIDITDAEDTLEIEKNISDYLSGTIRLAETGYNGKVKIRVPIEKIVNETLKVPAENISFVNVPEGLEIEVVDADQDITLEISGLSRYVSAVRGKDVRGVVDVAAWMEEASMETLSANVYTMPVQFELDEHITTAQQIELRVKVSEQE